MGEGVAYDGMPFPDTGCPVPDVYMYYMSDMIYAWDTVSTFIHLPWMFLLTDIIFGTTDLIIYNGPPLYQINMLKLG